MTENNIEYIELTRNTNVRGEVEQFFIELYQHLSEKGMYSSLVPDGEKMWFDSIEPALGKFSILVVAKMGGKVIGFAHGIIKLMPNYLGGEKIGFITNTYVSQQIRSQGVGRELIIKLEQWFRKQKVDFVEVETLFNNDRAVDFWNDIGYETRVYRFGKNIESN